MLQFMPISKSTDIDLNAHEDSSNLDNSGSTTKTSGHEIVNISKVPNNGNEHSEYEVNGVNGLSILEHSSPEPKRKTTTYQERVSYILIMILLAIKFNFESSPQPSIPNTFKYKSHPNAKAKALGSAK